MEKIYENKFTHKWKCVCGATYIKYTNEFTNYYIGKKIKKVKKKKRKK
jgi:hypothetical protein